MLGTSGEDDRSDGIDQIGQGLVESMGGIILRTSLLNLDVKVSLHPASDYVLFAHVYVIVA
jgi:hypothetical protein